jgi:hypothetical protein
MVVAQDPPRWRFPPAVRPLNTSQQCKKIYEPLRTSEPLDFMVFLKKNCGLHSSKVQHHTRYKTSVFGGNLWIYRHPTVSSGKTCNAFSIPSKHACGRKE